MKYGNIMEILAGSVRRTAYQIYADEIERRRNVLHVEFDVDLDVPEHRGKASLELRALGWRASWWNPPVSLSNLIRETPGLADKLGAKIDKLFSPSEKTNLARLARACVIQALCDDYTGPRT